MSQVGAVRQSGAGGGPEVSVAGKGFDLVWQMNALAFWKAVIVDREDLLERLVGLLDACEIRYCVIGGQAVNAYAEPVVSLDLDLVVAVDQIDEVALLLSNTFEVKRFPHSLNVSSPGSDLRVQIQMDARYASFPSRASRREILGLMLPVADIQDVLQGKVWAAGDPDRRRSKRQKDLADISRLLEACPALRDAVPGDILRRLF